MKRGGVDDQHGMHTKAFCALSAPWNRCLNFFPGHAGVKENDQADKLAGSATVTSGLHLRSEVLRSLRHYLWAQRQGHHTIDRLKERGVERESARHLPYKDERWP